MKAYKPVLNFVGSLTLITAFLHGAMGFSPRVSLYFGAPETLVRHPWLLLGACLLISVAIAISGLYALSGAGVIRPLPRVRPMLAMISSLLILRGLFLIPEFMIFWGLLEAPFPVPLRYLVFSLAILGAGLMYLAGTIGGWRALPAK